MNCRKCGTALPAGAMFCAECGATVTVPRLVEPQTRTRPGDTAIIQPLDVNAQAPEFLEPDFERVPAAPAPASAPSPAPASAPASAPVEPAPAHVETTPARPTVSPSVVPVVAPVTAPVTPVAAPVAAPVAPFAAPLVPPARAPQVTPTAARLVPPAAAPSTPPAAGIRPAPAQPPVEPPAAPLAAPPAHAADFESQHDDLEATRIVRNRQGDRFVLQFSTGENSTVFGSGLIGRNPVVQPGEFVDQLVTIVDSGKSVSKTHLEFGQTAGVFWIIDRFSANGTVIRQPDVRPQRLDPGKRQTIARGTRVDIGEQFFVVS